MPLDPILADAEFPGQHFDDREGFVSRVDAGRLAECIAIAAGDRHVGFHAASYLHKSILGDFGKLLFLSETVEEMIHTFVQYLNYFETGSRSSLEYTPSGAFWRFELVDLRTPGTTILEEFMLFQQIFILETALNGSWRPEGLILKRPGLLTGDAARSTNPGIASGMERNGIRLSSETLRKPVARLCAGNQPKRVSLIRALVEAAPPEDVLQVLEQSLRHALPSRQFALQQTAQRMSLSPRSLQRFLAGFGLTYSRIVDELRQRWARELLAETSMPISEIAFELGYTDPANFTRAFRRGAGESPRTFRQGMAKVGALSESRKGSSSHERLEGHDWRDVWVA